MENIEVVPLSEKTIKDALTLIHSIFTDLSEDENPDLWFTMSLDPKKYLSKMVEGGTKDVRYFVVIDTTKNKVIGTTGIYHEVDYPPTTAWLGWYCLDSNYRRRGIGTYILNWTIDKAISEGNSILNLYTSPHESPEAQIVYDKFGFTTFKTKKNSRGLVLYKTLTLQ